MTSAGKVLDPLSATESLGQVAASDSEVFAQLRNALSAGLSLLVKTQLLTCMKKHHVLFETMLKAILDSSDDEGLLIAANALKPEDISAAVEGMFGRV